MKEAGEIIMLTYRKRKAFRFDLELKMIEEMTIPTKIREGWGMTHVGGDLLISDGSHTLYYVDPKTFEIKDSFDVTDNGNPVSWINELEYINDKIYANIFTTNDLIVMDLKG